jgi:thioredoxin reductase (NADPH)
LRELGIMSLDGPCRAIAINGDQIAVETGHGRLLFDSLYPALGSDVRNELACQLGAALNDMGSIIADAHQRTNIPGLYAAGDVTLGLDQISHAMGEGGVAATTIRNDLAKERPLLR